MPLRAAAICGLLASVTFAVGLLLGDLSQPDAFSPANDDISDIGARTAHRAWIYNQIAANLNGLLILAFSLGLWRALGSGWLGRLGVLGLAVLGVPGSSRVSSDSTAPTWTKVARTPPGRRRRTESNPASQQRFSS